MTEVVPSASFDSLLGQFSSKFDQAEAADVIHELKRLYPTKDSFDQTELYGALKQLNVLGAIDEHGDQKVLKILAEKTSKKKEIVKLLNGYQKASSPRKDEFVGRDDDVSSILKLVADRRVPGVNLFGVSGVGKTTLAKKVSTKLAEKHFETFIIDLRGTKNMKTVYFKTLETFELTPWDYSKERIYTHLQVLTARTLFILDNVEQFFTNENEVDEKRMTECLEFLRTIMSSEASQRGSLKVILTSKIQIKDSKLEDIAFKEYEIQSLTKKASKQLISWRIKEKTDIEQDKALIEIADLCRNTPYLLERAEQLLRQNYSKPSEILEKLNALITQGVPEEYACMSLQFDSLPSDQIKEVAVKISLFCCPFSLSTAMKIAEISSDYDAELELEMLAKHKILTAEDVNGERKYDLHALFREFVTYLRKDHVYKDAYERAENQFVEHFSKKFVQLAKNLDKDFVGTYKELEEDKANLELSIDLITRKETLDLILQSDDVKETGSVAILFEAFKSIKERRKLFGEWAMIVERKESWLSSANFRCWESIQLADMEGTQNACEALKKAEMSLAKAMLLVTPEQVKAAKGLCKYCSGQIKRMTSENLIDESSKMEKERLLEQAIRDSKESLAIHRKVYGDHTLTARTLNLIGNCYMQCGKPKDAETFYQRAMEMKIKLVGSEKHFDIPTYYNQLSQVYEILGKQETSPETSWSFQSIANRIWSLISQEKRKQFEKAVHFLEKALSLQEELGVNDTDDTATFQRNLANILIGLGEYDQALEYAKKSFEIRNTNLGKHPETVRILYLTGIIHEWRNDRETALQTYVQAFVMEESLPEGNHSVVRKLLCDRLEEMCKKLKKKDKLEEYRPRMDKIRKETEADTGKNVDQSALFGVGKGDDAGHGKPTELEADVGRQTDVIKLDDKGGYYDFSSDYFFLEVPPNVAETPVKIKYKVDPCRCQPPMAGITTCVNYFLEMSSSMTVELSKPMTVTLMHSGPGKKYGYESTVVAFNQDKYVWEELKVSQGTRVSNLGQIKKDFIQVHIRKLTILAVVTRLITDRFQVTPKGCVARSSVCDDVTIEFPEGAVDKTVEGTMKVMQVDESLLTKENGYPFPIMCVDGFDGVQFQNSKLPIIKLSQPPPEKYSGGKICVLCLEDGKAHGETESQWKDITEEINIIESEDLIQLRVTHFSRLSVWKWKGSAPIKRISSVFKRLCLPQRRVCFAAFKEKKDPFNSFRLGLLCVDNRCLEDYSKLIPVTADENMRSNDKAYVEIKGDFRQEEEEAVSVKYLGDQACKKYVYVCKKEGIHKGGDEMLKVIFRHENQDLCLCKLSHKAKDIPSSLQCSNSETPSFNLSDEQKRWLVVGIGLNKTLLPPLRGFLKQQMDMHYTNLKTTCNIHSQSNSMHLADDHGRQLNYKSINSNEAKKKKTHLYDFDVKCAEDLGKLYLMPFMAKFKGFDGTCDLSAVLGILSSASIFSPDVQKFANDVKNKVRNEWAHCNFQEWTITQFTRCFQLMKFLLQALKLPLQKEKSIMDELEEWETKGVDASSSATFIEFANVEIKRLSQERLEASQKEEDEKIATALRHIVEIILQNNKKQEKKLQAMDNRITTLEKEQECYAKEIKGLKEKQESGERKIETMAQKVKDITSSTDEEPVECFGILITEREFKDLPEDIISLMMTYFEVYEIPGKETGQWKPEDFLRNITKDTDKSRRACLRHLLEVLQTRPTEESSSSQPDLPDFSVSMSHVIALLSVGKELVTTPLRENQKLKEKTIEIIIRNPDYCWETFAGHLGIDEEIVERFRENHPGDTLEVTSHILRKWIDTSDKSCTLEDIFDAFRLCGYKDTGIELATYTTKECRKKLHR